MNGDDAARFTFDPVIIAALVSYALIYWYLFRRARESEGARGAPALRAVAFGAAILVLAAATITPVASLGEERLFSMHMLQHLLMGDIAPALALLGLSRVMMRPATRRLQAVERALGSFAHPVAFLLAWAALVYVWHVPAVYDAALGSGPLHALEHGVFFAAGLLFWWPLIEPVPMRHPLRGLQPFAYLFAGKAILGPLGVALTWSSKPFYDHYLDVPRTWGLTPKEDQNLGGAIMMAEQSILLVIALVALFIVMLRRSEQEEVRRERLEEMAAARERTV